MGNDEYRTAAAIRYGWGQFEGVEECLDCGKYMDVKGNHAIHCESYGGFTTRHNKLRDCLFRWFKKVLFLAEKEKIGLLSDGKKPADIYVQSYLGGRDWAFDVTVVSPMSAGYQCRAQREVLAAATMKARTKYNNYRGSYEDRDWKFQPLVFECTGGWDGPTSKTIRAIAQSVANRMNVRWQIIESLLKRELSSIVIQGTARMVMRRQIRGSVR